MVLLHAPSLSTQHLCRVGCEGVLVTKEVSDRPSLVGEAVSANQNPTEDNRDGATHQTGEEHDFDDPHCDLRYCESHTAAIISCMQGIRKDFVRDL